MTSMTTQTHSSELTNRNRIGVMALVALLTLFTVAAAYHIWLQPYPSVWDDGTYASKTFDWLAFVQRKGLLRGLVWGFIFELPGYMPPLVYLTGLAGVLIYPNLIAMPLAQLVWFVIMGVAAYETGRYLKGVVAGLLCGVFVYTTSLVFFWGRMMMGEPSMFAMSAVLACLLVVTGDQLTLKRSLAIGLAVGLGLWSKQNYPFVALGMLLVWGFWLLIAFIRQPAQRAMLIRGVLVTGITATSVAAIWFYWHYKDALYYYTSAGVFRPHYLAGNLLQTFWAQLGILNQWLGWPVMLSTALGIGFACIRLWVGLRTGQLWRDWHLFALALLLVGGAASMASTVYLRNNNARFFAPAFVPWAILIGLMYGQVLISWRRLGPMLVGIAMLLHSANGWNQLFAPVLPTTGLFQQTVVRMRPVSTAPLPDAMQFMDAQQPSSLQHTPKIFLVGNNERFCETLIMALAQQHGFNWQVKQLYGWEDLDLNPILHKMEDTDWVMIHQRIQPDVPYEINEFNQFDDAIANWLAAHPEKFVLATHPEDRRADNRILVYRRR